MGFYAKHILPRLLNLAMQNIESLILEAGFQIAELRKIYLPGPRPMTYTYQGLAN